MDVIVALLIDDNVPSRGHRHNIFQKDFFKMACFTGPHKTYGSQTVINYNGSNAERDARMAQTKASMDEFIKKEVDYGPKPEGCTGWSTKTGVQSGGGKLKKTSTITYKMRDGSTKSKTIVEEIDI